MDLNILIGGEAGQGLKTVESLLTTILFRQGFYVYSTKDYMSRIRGGHNFMEVRISDKPVHGPTNEIDVLVALNDESVDLHLQDLNENGVIISASAHEDRRMERLPAKEIAKEVNPRAVNTVFIGGVIKVLGLALDEAETIIKEHFSDDKEVVEDNIELLKKGYELLDKAFLLERPGRDKEMMLIDGNSAVGLGAALAGVSYYAAYPMSPSTGILTYLARKQEELGIVVEQAEDEIAAINMALGGSYSGIRSMTGTSGGGLALMAEGIGLAGIAELPVVITDVQRPGPATGLPTRTGQGDLLFAINIAQDEFPLMVLAPRDQEDAVYQSFRALNIADKYQMPVIILSDQFLGDGSKTINEINLDKLEIDRHLITEQELAENGKYKRYKMTEDGISPRSYPGQFADQVVLIDSDEHDELGHIVEDAEARTAMVDKRNRKLIKLIKEDLQEPEYKGPEAIDYLLVSWGSTCGPLSEARDLLAEKAQVGMLAFNDIWPLPVSELKKRAAGAKVIVVEANTSSQFAKLIKSETDLSLFAEIVKYDGRPFVGKELYQKIKDEVM